MDATLQDDQRSRADELYSQGQYAEAATIYEQLLKEAPASAQLMRVLGLSLVLDHRPEEGIAMCKKAGVLQPTDPEVRYAYGYALGAAHRYDEAIPELDAALSLKPNHIPAKQALVYALATRGKELLDTDAMGAERNFDRAYKMDSKNPAMLALLLDAYVKSHQKGKAIALIKSADEQTKSSDQVRSIVKMLEADPEYQASLKQVAMQSKPLDAKPANPQPEMQQVPCPQCKLPIMSFAALCPHCGYKIRAMGTFAGRDAGPAVEWQEVAFTIMAIIWVALAGFQLYSGLQIKFEGLQSYVVIMAAIQIGVGLGLLFRVEWLGFVGKIMCYLTLLSASIGVMTSMGLGRWLLFGMNILQLAVAGFMIYLINYVMGD